MRCAVFLLLLATICAALDPAEIYDRAAPATILIDGTSTAGTAIGEGLFLTTERATRGRQEVGVSTRDGAKATATVVARDTVLNIAVLKAKLETSVVELAPPIRATDAIAEMRVYSIGHGAKRWKFHQGYAESIGAVPGKLSGLRLVVHDAFGEREGAGGPLLTSSGKLFGMSMAGWGAAGKAPDTMAYAVPVNAIRAFLAASRVEGFAKLPADALGVFAKQKPEPEPEPKPEPEVEQPEEPEEAVLPPTKEGLIPAGLRFGPYVHLIESREAAALKRRAATVLKSLRGLYYRCPRCKGKGTIEVVIREGYTERDGSVIPPVYETQTCTRCKGDKSLFRSSVASSAFDRYARKASAGARAAFIEKARASRRTFLRQPAIKAEARGIHGIVRGASSNRLFPLHFHLLPDGRKYEWFLSGSAPARTSFPSSEAVVAEVAAGDILILSDRTVVRICGIVIPDSRGKVPRPDARQPNERLRDITRRALLGQRVKLSPDKYSKMTCDGHPLVYVEFRNRDWAEELLKRGRVRRHNRHKHSRHVRYQRAESAAKKAKVGIWKK